MAPAGDEPGVFGGSTCDAVRAFQDERGLHANGQCDEQTWTALVEAGWKLGDRLLLLTAPMQRGDDVGELQSALNRLGFDCGRPDGILGPATSRALVDFQRNSGLTTDGVCGTQTVRMLELVSRQSGSGPGVASVRESESATAVTPLHALRIVVGQFGGLSTITRALARSLRDSGATVISTDEYEASAQAAAANRFGASLYVGFEARAEPASMIAYFAVPAFESVGGRALAVRVAGELATVLDRPAELRGMRLPVLRETRMPAVLCSLGPVRAVVDATDDVTSAIGSAIHEWATSPWSEPSV
jgi:N-acetylmuramoyl-L-alanine amidase